jgi:predicted metal-dependent hydrolase
MNLEIMAVNGVDYTVKIHYERRKNTTVSIRKQIINIRIPSFLSQKEKNNQLNKMKKWAEEKIRSNPEKFKPKPCKNYHDKDVFNVGKERYILNIEHKDKASSSAKLKGDNIYLRISSQLSKQEQNNHISNLLSRCIAHKKLPELKEKIDALNKQHFKQKINKVHFKNHKSKWGSCSHKGNINISTRLLFTPEDVFDYVCIHELAHLIEHNHSKRFWTLVEKAMPDYKEKQKWLKENGDVCCNF